MISKLPIGNGTTYPAVIEVFTCDMCGLPGEKVTHTQKRHTGKCHAAYIKGLHSGAVKRTGIRARQLRRIERNG